MAAAPPNILIQKLELTRKNGTHYKSMKAVHRIRIQAQEKQYGKARPDTIWEKAGSTKSQNKPSKFYKKGEDGIRVSKNNASSDNAVLKYSNVIASAAGTVGETRVEDDVVEKTLTIIDAVSTQKILGIPSEAGENTAVEKMNVEDAIAGKPPVESAGGSALLVSGTSTDRSKIVGVSTPKTASTQSEAAESKPKTGESDKEENYDFVNENKRRKKLSSEEAFRYKNLEHENKRRDRKFCASYEYLLASITCSMKHCKKH